MPPASVESRYKVLHRLASGGMADVYLAVLKGAHGFEKQTIVKRMRADFADHEEFRRMFIDEARLMASLSHGNIVSVLDFGEGDDGIFIALEHVDGLDLRRLLKRVGPLEPELAIHIGSCVLHALAYLHGHTARDGQPLHVVHRDVSPSNIFLGLNGDVKLGDFGVAKAAQGSVQTAPGTIKGKLAYMSPEQAAARDVDGRSDLFSMGVVLYEALTGKRPFAASSDLELLKQLVSDEETGPLEVPKDVSPPLAAFLRRALTRDRRERFQTAEEMSKALLACASGPPLGPSDVARLVKTTVQPTDLAPPADPFAQALGLAAQTTTDGLAATTPARPPRKPPSRGVIAVAAAVIALALAGSTVIAWRLARNHASPVGSAAPPTAAAPSGPPPSAVNPPDAPTTAAAPSGPQPSAVNPPDAPTTAAAPPGRQASAVNPPGALPSAAPDPRQPGEPVPEVPAPGTRQVAQGPHPASATRRPGPHAKVGRATLVVNSTPWAKVYVDGAPAGDTPTSELSLDSGRHRLRLVNPPSGKSFETTIELTPGERRVLPVDLETGKLAGGR